ncbi:hypothetical protein COOONC_05648 [Cooperia oncophora]
MICSITVVRSPYFEAEEFTNLRDIIEIDTTNVTTESATSDIKLLKEPVRVKIQRGVRQGEVISPKLFSAALELVMRQIELPCGIEIDGERLQYLMFADDIVLIGSEPSALESSLNILSEASQSIGLVIHPGKTKWMKNNYTNDYRLCQVFNTHVLPALVYGSETWSTIKDEERRLAATQRAMGDGKVSS